MSTPAVSSKHYWIRNLWQPRAAKTFSAAPSFIRPPGNFLVHFGLKDLSDLPSMEEFEELIKNQAAAEEEIAEQTELPL